MPASRYELKELLGEGGMGVVYRALDTRTSSYVALKTLRDSSDPATLEMFKREWAELAKLSHPNIVDIRDVDEIVESGVRKPCFIMPLLPGATLATLINTASPRITVEFVVSLISQVCKGLQAAHEKDLIHRDLKPSNIFVMDDDTAKIIDFGLVHAIGNKSVTGLKGTWQYMSPEQIEGKPPNRSFDIFSLGIVAYEALTGRQPFKRARFEDTVDAIRHCTPQAISEMNPRVPQLLSRAVHVAMAKQPIHRYNSAREFAETLQKAYNNQYMERFDPAKIRPRIDRAKRAFAGGDSDFASEILTELEAEGNLDTDITLLRSQIDESNKHKRIRQLLEAAQARLEQDEIPLALEKLNEVLKIDSEHPEALQLRRRIDQQRSQQQVSDWLNLARQHLERNDFREARLALKEVFNLKYDDPEAGHLKAEIDTREKDVATARNEKEHLYSSALKAHQNGEISSALSKLAKILDLSRGVPGASVPERDKVYQAFYNDVRIERDHIDNAYAEGARHLSEKAFEKALEVCDGILSRYPHNAQFQALRLKVEHSQRQELSAYIAEVGRAVDSEPNLERRVGLLEDACKRYPKEAQFKEQLSLAHDLRDLVASIVTRARAYEEQGQFAEAITQWNTLANTHPQYPGIDFEISQLDRRRERQAEDEKKSRLVQKIDRALENSAYADAERLSQNALLEFPQNQELLVLLGVARQGLERTQEANRLFEEAKALRAKGDWEKAAGQLRQALDLDKRNIVVQNTLVNLLVERAHALLDTDQTAAELLAAEAGRLDPEHPSVSKVISLIAQAKKKDYIERCVLQARALQTSDVERAVDILRDALAVYPGELRLQQTLTSLQKEDSRAAGSSIIKYSPAEKETSLFPLDYTEQAPIPPPPIQPLPPPGSPPQPGRENPFETTHRIGANLTHGFAGLFSSLFGRNSRRTNLYGALLGLLAFALLAGLYHRYSNRPAAETRIQPPPPSEVNEAIEVAPNDASVTLDGKPITERALKLEKGTRHQLTVFRAGYKTAENAVEATAEPWRFTLDAEPLRVSVFTSQPSGSVWLDGQRAGELAGGEWSADYPLKANEEQHSLTVKGKNGELFRAVFKAVAGKLAVVNPVQSKDLIVASSLGKDAMLYAGSATATLALEGKERQTIPPEGLAIQLDDAPDGFPIANGTRTDHLRVAGGNAPALSFALNAQPSLATINVTSTPKNATLLIDGTPQKPRNPGVWSWAATPGTSYKAKLTADGMTPEEFDLIVRKGQTLNRDFVLKALGPAFATLLIEGGTPGASVSVDDSVIGELNDQGDINYPNISPGFHDIELKKAGYGARTSRQNFAAGKTLKLPGDNTLSVQMGSVTFSVSPPAAAVHYRKTGETAWRPVDIANALRLAPGSYEFSAEAANYTPNFVNVTIEADRVKPLTLILAEETRTPPPVPVVNVDDTRRSGDWYTGKQPKSFITVRPGFAKNTLIFLKKPKPKHVVWMVSLDGANSLAYSLDSQGVSVTKLQDGTKTTFAVPIDASNSDGSATYAVVIHLGAHGVRITKRDGTLIHAVGDDQHDWSQAHISVKGDAYFVVWLGR